MPMKSSPFAAGAGGDRWAPPHPAATAAASTTTIVRRALPTQEAFPPRRVGNPLAPRSRGSHNRGMALPSANAADESLPLVRVAADVTGTLDLQQVLDKSFAALRTLVQFDGGAIQLVDAGFLVAVATDPPATAEAMAVRIPVGQGVSGRIAADGEPIYIADITTDDRVHPDGRKKGLSPVGVRSYF